MNPTLVKYRNRQVFAYPRCQSDVTFPKIAGISCILILSLTLFPSSFINSYAVQGHVLQTINLNQHLLWQYSLSDDLEIVKMSTNGRLVAVITGTAPSKLIVLDGTMGHALWEFTPTGLAPENRTITCLGVSANGEYLAIGTSGGSVYLFHRSSNVIIQTWQAYTSVTAIALSELGTFVSIAFAGHVYHLQRLDGIVIWGYIFARSPNTISNLTIDQTGSHLAISTSSPSLAFVFTSTEFYWNQSISAPTTAIQLNAEGTRLFVADQSSCRLFDQNGGITQFYNIIPRVFVFSEQGNRLVIAPNETVFVYSATSPDSLTNHTFLGETPTSLGISFNEDILILGTQSGTLYTINPTNFETLWSLPLGEPIFHILTPNSGDTFLIATPSTLLHLRISSITGFYVYLIPIVIIIVVSVVVGIITIIFLRPKQRQYNLAQE